MDMKAHNEMLMAELHHNLGLSATPPVLSPKDDRWESLQRAMREHIPADLHDRIDWAHPRMVAQIAAFTQYTGHFKVFFSVLTAQGGKALTTVLHNYGNGWKFGFDPLNDTPWVVVVGDDEYARQFRFKDFVAALVYMGRP